MQNAELKSELLLHLMQNRLLCSQGSSSESSGILPCVLQWLVADIYGKLCKEKKKTSMEQDFPLSPEPQEITRVKECI